MATTLSINAHETAAPVGASIFELAEQVGVNVPTSCRKQGKCRECLVEVVEGMDRLTPRGPEENYLKEGFRLSCRARVIDGVDVREMSQEVTTGACGSCHTSDGEEGAPGRVIAP